MPDRPHVIVPELGLEFRASRSLRVRFALTPLALVYGTFYSIKERRNEFPEFLQINKNLRTMYEIQDRIQKGLMDGMIIPSQDLRCKEFTPIEESEFILEAYRQQKTQQKKILGS